MTPKNSVSFWAPVAGAHVAIAVRDLAVPDADSSGDWVVATEENRGGRRTEAIALSATSGAGFGPFELQHTGTIDAEISGLGAAPGRSLVRCSSTGRIERIATDEVDPETDDIVGYAEPNGRVHLYFGFPFAEVLSLSGGGGATPGGSVGDAMVHGTDGTLAPMRDPDGNAPAVGAGPRWDGTKAVWRNDTVELPDDVAPGDFFFMGAGGDLARLAPPEADGTYGVVWSGGLPTGWAVAGGGDPDPWNPLSIAWSLFCWASYDDAAAWPGEASTGGGSGAITLDSGSRPAEGTAVNGYVPAVFGGTQYLGASDGAAYIAEDGYTFSALIYLTAYAASDKTGTEYDYPAIIQDAAANWGLFVSTNGVGLYHNDTDTGVKVRTSALALNTWAHVVGTYDGTNIALWINAVSGTPLAAVDLNPTHVTTTPTVGQNYAGTKIQARVLHAGIRPGALTSTQIGDFKTTLNTRLGLGL